MLSVVWMHIECLAEEHVSLTAQVSPEVVLRGQRHVAHAAVNLAYVLVEAHKVKPTEALCVQRAFHVTVKLVRLFKLDVAQAAAVHPLIALASSMFWALGIKKQQPLDEQLHRALDAVSK